MAVRLKWRGKEFNALVARKVRRGIAAATVELHKIAQKMASIPNTGQTVEVQRQTPGGNKSTRTVYPNSSKPGEPVRRRTGHGQKNIVYIVTDTVGRVGYTANARYMTFHELGIRYTRGIQQRPTIVPALWNNLPRLKAIFRRVAEATK